MFPASVKTPLTGSYTSALDSVQEYQQPSEARMLFNQDGQFWHSSCEFK